MEARKTGVWRPGGGAKPVKAGSWEPTERGLEIQEAWKPRNLEVWRLGGLEVGKTGRLEARRQGKLRVWRLGDSEESWKLENLQV